MKGCKAGARPPHPHPTSLTPQIPTPAHPCSRPLRPRGTRRRTSAFSRWTCASPPPLPPPRVPRTSSARCAKGGRQGWERRKSVGAGWVGKMGRQGWERRKGGAAQQKGSGGWAGVAWLPLHASACWALVGSPRSSPLAAQVIRVQQASLHPPDPAPCPSPTLSAAAAVQGAAAAAAAGAGAEASVDPGQRRP